MAKLDTAREKTKPDVKRGERGRWLKGSSPNPGGRPRGQREFADLIRLATDDGRAQVELAIDILSDDLEEPVSPAVRLEAAKWLTERMIGKAPDKIELTGKDGGPVEVNDARERLAARIAARLAALGADGAPGEPERR